MEGWQVSVMCLLITVQCVEGWQVSLVYADYCGGWQVSVVCMLITVEGGRCLSCVC